MPDASADAAGAPFTGRASGAGGAGGAASDGGIGNEPPALLLRAAELSYEQGELGTARALLGLALSAIARAQPGAATIAVTLGAGAADPEVSDFGVASAADAAIAASGERAAIAHGRLLSVVELDGGYALRRLYRHPQRLRRVVADRAGQRFLTLADDGLVRLIAGTGEPGPSWPLAAPADPAHPGQPGRESTWRARWLDFSPDGRLVFLADCGSAAGPDCPLRRLRVFSAERGELLQTFTQGEQELLDYTATRDGTLALLFAGRPPQLYAATSGGALQLGSSVRGAAAAACLSRPRIPGADESPWVVSPDRQWLATLALPAAACLWSLQERQLVAAAVLASGRQESWHLESLLGDKQAATLILKSEERGRGRQGVLIDPQTGRQLAAVKGLAAVLPLDDGGAFLTGRADDGGPRANVQLFRLSPDRRLQRLPGTERLLLPCLFASPDAVQGDGGRALFSPLEPSANPGCAPALVELAAPRSARLRRVPLPGSAPLVAADFIDAQRLVMIDAAGRLQVLRDAQVEYVSPKAAAAVTRLGFVAPEKGAPATQLELETADGKTRTLWLLTGQLQLLTPERVVPARTGSGAALQTDAPSGGLRAEVTGEKPPQVLLRSLPERQLRWQLPLSGLSAISALAFSPDSSALLIGGTGGTVIWLRVSDHRELVRLRLSAPDASSKDGAVALYPDGYFEVLGALEHPADYVFCQAGTYPIPFPLCAERLRAPGRLKTVLAP